jgi:hypothetical protein
VRLVTGGRRTVRTSEGGGERRIRIAFARWQRRLPELPGEALMPGSLDLADPHGRILGLLPLRTPPIGNAPAAMRHGACSGKRECRGWLSGISWHRICVECTLVCKTCTHEARRCDRDMDPDWLVLPPGKESPSVPRGRGLGATERPGRQAGPAHGDGVRHERATRRDELSLRGGARLPGEGALEQREIEALLECGG